MIWNKHFVKTEHAFLGASKYHWINYDEDKLKASWISFRASQEGTRLHAYAKEAIELGIKQRKSNRTLERYINDAISYRMTPELLLYYSENCFGTADAISYDEEKHFLRIHDLKTGKIPAHMEQLLVYTALFCLDYGVSHDVKPGEIQTELRIYQNDQILYLEPESDEIAHIMDKIIVFDKYIDQLKEEM